MVKQPGVWGIDLGQCALKAVRLENIGGTITATAFEYIEHPKILSQPDADSDELAREALQQFLKRNDIRGDQVAISLPGQQGLARFVKLPPVEEKKINDIVKFEAKQQIPFPLEEVIWDYQKIGAGMVADGFAMETEIGLFAIKREAVLRALDHYQVLDVDVHIIQLAPLALCNFIAYDLLKKDGLAEGNGAAESNGKRKCVVALDIGVDNSNLVITDGERIVWQRPIPVGGNRFTRSLTKEMKLTYAKAEHLKRNAAKSPQLKNILMAMRADLAEFANEIQKSLDYFKGGQKDAQIQYIVGLGNAFKLPGLQKYLMEKLQLEVKRLPKYLRLSGDAVVTAPVFNDNIMSMGTAYGLALQGLKLSRIQTNLLPRNIAVDRIVKAKKPWAVSAAACLLLGTGILAFGYRMQHDAYASPAIEKAMQESGLENKVKNLPGGALQNVRNWEDKVKRQTETNRNLELAVGSIVAGQKERTNWLNLNKVINSALPRSDGSNLTERQRTAYWERGKVALQNRSLGGEDPSDSGQGDLIQISLDATNALYTDKLPEYFERLREQCKRDEKVVLDSMPEEEQKTPPTGGGWVVELRGYTYHYDQRLFIVNTLIANLQDQAKQNQISHLVLYRYHLDREPAGQQFHLIRYTDLAHLVMGIKPEQIGTALKEAPVTGGQAPPKIDYARAPWKPVTRVFGEPKVRNPYKEEEKPKASKEQVNVRTEFVILFIWKEPLGEVGATTAKAAAKTP